MSAPAPVPVPLPLPLPLPVVARTANCEFCHQRPKNAGHRYCSKTCATQAAQVTTSNCNYCHQKPKFGSFEYCGKHCAAQAQKTVKPQPQVPQTRAQATTGNVAVTVSNKSTQQTQKGSKTAIVQAAPATVIPQIQTQAQQQVQLQPVQPQSQSSWMKKAAAQIPKILTNNSSSQSATNATGVCAIPGCGVSVHVDPHGYQTSEYCSQSHREEAVDAGLVSPCVMCLSMPQSKSDYFCSRLCREEANHKTQ